jgi:hypothetical protein
MLHVFVKEFNNKCDIRKTQAFTVLPSKQWVGVMGIRTNLLPVENPRSIIKD